MKDLTVFVLTHNRKELLLETIQSILHQTCHDFKFIVSDNSSDNETTKLLTENNLLDKFEYRKRNKEYTGSEHLNLCLSEVDTKYFILFHDDDIMLPNMVERLYSAINGSDYAAVGCNAYIMKDCYCTKKMLLRGQKNIVLKTPENMIKQYLNAYSIVPFPSHIYDKEKLKKLKFTNLAEKHSDVVWLLQCNEIASILWLSDVLMYYRQHSYQDSSSYDYIAQLKLIAYFRKFIKNDDKLLKKYRYLQLYLNASKKLNNGMIAIEKELYLLVAHPKYFIKLYIKRYLPHIVDIWRGTIK